MPPAVFIELHVVQDVVKKNGVIWYKSIVRYCQFSELPAFNRVCNKNMMPDLAELLQISIKVLIFLSSNPLFLIKFLETNSYQKWTKFTFSRRRKLLPKTFAAIFHQVRISDVQLRRITISASSSNINVKSNFFPGTLRKIRADKKKKIWRNWSRWRRFAKRVLIKICVSQFIYYFSARLILIR